MRENETGRTSAGSNGEDVGGLLRGLGDDGGRPLPMSPEERLQQVRGRERRRRRRTTLAGASLAVAAVGAVVVGGQWVGQDRGVIRTEPAASGPASPSAAAPRGEVFLAERPLVHPFDMPRLHGYRWSSSLRPTSEGDCDAPLSTRRGYQSEDIRDTLGGRAWAFTVAGQEKSADEAARVYDDTVEALRACFARPQRDARVVGEIPVAGADEAHAVSIAVDCATTTCKGEDGILVHQGVARVGRVLVTVHLGSTGTPQTAPMRPEHMSELMAAALHNAVAPRIAAGTASGNR